jgi:uncharacterized protein YbaR (Trm112 family)
MAIHKDEDIIAYQVDELVVCPECITKEELDRIWEEHIIMEKEDQTVFCDRCKKRL